MKFTTAQRKVVSELNKEMGTNLFMNTSQFFKIVELLIEKDIDPSFIVEFQKASALTRIADHLENEKTMKSIFA